MQCAENIDMMYGTYTGKIKSAHNYLGESANEDANAVSRFDNRVYIRLWVLADYLRHAH